MPDSQPEGPPNPKVVPWSNRHILVIRTRKSINAQFRIAHLISCQYSLCLDGVVNTVDAYMGELKESADMFRHGIMNDSV